MVLNRAKRLKYQKSGIHFNSFLANVLSSGRHLFSATLGNPSFLGILGLYKLAYGKIGFAVGNVIAVLQPENQTSEFVHLV